MLQKLLNYLFPKPTLDTVLKNSFFDVIGQLGNVNTANAEAVKKNEEVIQASLTTVSELSQENRNLNAESEKASRIAAQLTKIIEG